MRQLTCIECPRGCLLKIEEDHGKVVSVSGNLCPKGETYGRLEVEQPARIITSTVVAEGLELRMVPVKTSAPVAKDKILQAMEVIRGITLTRPVALGEVVSADLLGTGIDLVATRSVAAAKA